MESQMHRPTAQEQPPQHGTEVVEGQADHGEKKSMMKKVKEKAKKIKDTIKKKGLGNKADELADDGGAAAPAAGTTTTNLPHVQQTADDHSDNVNKGQDYATSEEKGLTSSPPQAVARDFDVPKPIADEPEVKETVTKPDVAGAADVESSAKSDDVLEEDPRSLKGPDSTEVIPPSSGYQSDDDDDSAGKEGVSRPGVIPATEHTGVLEEDPNSLKDRTEDIPPSNYQTKAVDPTCQGVEEANVDSLTGGLSPAQEQTQTQNVESKSLAGGVGEQPRSYDGSNDQTKLDYAADSTGQDPALKQEILSADKFEEDPHALKDGPEDISPSNYQTKVVDSSSQGGKEADVDSSLSQGLTSGSTAEQPQSEELKSLAASGQEQQPHSSSYGGSHDQFAPQSTPPTEESFLPQSHPAPEGEPELPQSTHPREVVVDHNTAAKDIDSPPPTQGLEKVTTPSSESEALKEQTQSHEPKTLSAEEESSEQPRSYHDQSPTEDTLLPASHPKDHHDESVLQDTTADKEEASPTENAANRTQETPSDANAQEKKPITETAAEYKNMVAEKLAPVYEKVSVAGVLSKVRGSGAAEEQQPQGGGEGDGVVDASKVSSDSDKGDEDKATSKATAEKLQVNRQNEAQDGESKAAVESNKQQQQPNNNNGSSPTGVMSSLKGVVGSWLGTTTKSSPRGDDQQQSGISHGNEEETVAREN